MDEITKLNQKGGASISYLKGINLFEKDSVEQIYLDPTYGYIYLQNFILNSLIFGNDNKYIVKLINSSFHKFPNNPIYLTKNIVKQNSTDIAKFIGQYLGYYFTNYIKNKDVKKPNKKRPNPNKRIKSTFPQILKEGNNTGGNIIFGNIDKQLLTPYIFRIILAILWKKSNNKSDIKAYYEGLIEYGVNVDIPQNFETDIFTTPELNIENEKFTDNQLLALSHLYFKGYIKIDHQKMTILKSNKYNSEYPDCGSISLRNFIKLLLINYESNQFDINILRTLKATKPLIDYFSIFNTDLLITSETPKYIKIIYDSNNIVSGLEETKGENEGETKGETKGENEGENEGEIKKITPRNAWGYVVSNLEGVKYLKSNCCEINSGTVTLKNETIPNMLQVVRKLFNKIKTFSDFNKINGIIMNLSKSDSDSDSDLKPIYDLNQDGFGYILFKKNNFFYKWNFNIGHYYIESVITNNSIPDIFKQNNIINDLYLSLNEGLSIKNIPLFKKYTNELIIDIFNQNMNTLFENKNRYNIFIKYIQINLNNDEKDRLKMKIKNLEKNNDSIIDLTISNFEKLDLVVLNKFINLESLTFENNFDYSLDNYLDELTNLKSLTFETFFEQSLYNSLDKLTNLKSLTFEDGFEQSLDNSLDKLTNLESLILGEGFEQSLDNSLDKLTNLKSLTLGFVQPPRNSSDNLIYSLNEEFNDFNKPLDDSLNSLINLQTLTFGRNFNKPLAGSLNSLINLQTLTFGRDFDQSIKGSLNSLINLQTLTFGQSFDKPLAGSLDRLINLQTLTFGSEFDQSIKGSLDRLINLQTLNLGEYFDQPINGSLNSLINLQTLTFGYSFNQPLADSLDRLINLQTLTFGYSFNQPLADSLDRLINLQTLTFGYSFNQSLTLGDSLDIFSENRLTNLETLTLGRDHDLITLSPDFNKLNHNIPNLNYLKIYIN